MPTPPRQRRRIKLIKPRMQLRLAGIFIGLTALGFLMQALLLSLFLSQTAAAMPEGGSHLMGLLPSLPIEVLLISYGLFLPLVCGVGILVTFRIAGPIYRFEQFLTRVASGKQIGPCKLRDGDDLGELCEIINNVTEPLRQGEHKVEAEAQVESDELRAAG